MPGETGPLLSATQESDVNVKLYCSDGTSQGNPGWPLLARKDLCKLRDGSSGGQTRWELAVCSFSKTGQWHWAVFARVRPESWRKGFPPLFPIYEMASGAVSDFGFPSIRNTLTYLIKPSGEPSVWVVDWNMLCTRSWMYSEKWVWEKAKDGSCCSLQVPIGRLESKS